MPRSAWFLFNSLLYVCAKHDPSVALAGETAVLGRWHHFSYRTVRTTNTHKCTFGTGNVAEGVPRKVSAFSSVPARHEKIL